jgi:hypothetical protein
MLSEIYWSFFTTSVITACLAVFTLCYRSKCRECNFCGCKIIRDVEGEERIDELRIEKREEKINDV